MAGRQPSEPARSDHGNGPALEAFLLVYLAASFLHFSHNAEYVQAYPNLPAWITRSSVYLAWLGITTVGLAGYWFYRYGPRLVGLVLLCLYGAGGLDGLLHYTLAPMGTHTPAMNATIWFEAAAAAVLLVCLATTAGNQLKK